MEVKFPVYWGGEKIATEYRISGIPLIYFVMNGKIVEKVLGKRGERFIEEKIVSLLDKCKK